MKIEIFYLSRACFSKNMMYSRGSILPRMQMTMQMCGKSAIKYFILITSYALTICTRDATQTLPFAIAYLGFYERHHHSQVHCYSRRLCRIHNTSFKTRLSRYRSLQLTFTRFLCCFQVFLSCHSQVSPISKGWLKSSATCKNGAFKNSS